MTAFGVTTSATHAYIVKDQRQGTEDTIKCLPKEPGKILDEMGISTGPNDIIETYEINEKTTEIKISETITVKVNYQNTITEIRTAGKTVKDLLDKKEITLGEFDVLVDPEETELFDGIEIFIDKIESKETIENIEIPFKTTTNTVDSLAPGAKAVVTPGKTGTKEITKKQTFKNGVLTIDEITGEKIIAAPTDEIVNVGGKKKKVSKNTPTAPAAKPAPSNFEGAGTFTNNGETISYSKVLTGDVTSYTDKEDSFGSRTSTGVRATAGKTVAVDPRLIPYGSTVYFEHNGKIYGPFVAQDTGGFCRKKGNKILLDVFYGNLGRIRGAKVYVVKK